MGEPPPLIKIREKGEQNDNRNNDTQILIGGTDECAFDWANLDLKYNQPNEDEGYLGLTFYIKDDYDPRQF